MKKLVYLLAVICLAAISCTSNSTKTESAHPEWCYNTVVYEMNVRQYTPEGTFAAAAEHLPRLKELGVDIVWLKSS